MVTKIQIAIMLNLKVSNRSLRFNDAEQKLNTSQTLLSNALAALAGGAGAGGAHAAAAAPQQLRKLGGRK